MNWNKIKTFLIALLLCVNVYLLYMLNAQYRINYLIDPDMKRDTIELLADSGIAVEDATIPNRLISCSVYESAYGDSYYETVLRAVSGTEDYSLHMMTNGIKCIVGSSGDVYEFYDSPQFSMKYIAGGTENEDAWYEALFEKLPLDYASSAGDSSVSAGNLKKNRLRKIAEAFLSPSDEYAADGENSVSDVSLGIKAAYYDKESKKYVVYAYQICEDCAIEDGDIRLILSGGITGGNVEYASGTVVWLVGANKYSSELIDQLNILFKEREYSESEGDETDGETRTITSVASEYCVNWNAQRDTFYLIPAWRIEYLSGITRIHNAINGAVYAK